MQHLVTIGLGGLGVAMGRISGFPIDLRRHPYNSLAPPCECVMSNSMMTTFTSRVYTCYVFALTDYPNGWVFLPSVGKYYRVVFQKVTLATARTSCAAFAPTAHPVAINDKDESQAVQQLIASFPRKQRCSLSTNYTHTTLKVY